MAELFSLQELEERSEEEILELLEQRLLELLSQDAEQFFHLMYRLDVAEDALSEALKSSDPPKQLALLIYNRQVQKIHSRSKFNRQNQPDNEDPDLLW